MTKHPSCRAVQTHLKTVAAWKSVAAFLKSCPRINELRINDLAADSAAGKAVLAALVADLPQMTTLRFIRLPAMDVQFFFTGDSTPLTKSLTFFMHDSLPKMRHIQVS